MNFSKFWLCCCALFCIYCLSILSEESYQVTYLAEEDDVHKDREVLQYLWCFRLKSLHLNRTRVEMHELLEIFSKKIQDQLIARRVLSSKPWRRELIINRTSSADSVVIACENVCVILRSRSEFLDFQNELTSFIRAEALFAFKADTFDWTKMDDYENKFNQLIVQDYGRPYTNCSKGIFKFHCLNECFKGMTRFSRYFYFLNERSPIYLSSQNQTVKDHEDACFEKCSENNCKLVYLSQNPDEDKPERVFIFRAHPSIGYIDFGVQLAGLVCLVLNASFNRLLSITISFASRKLRTGNSENGKIRSRRVWNERNKRISNYLLYLRLFALFVGLFACGYLFVRMMIDYRNKSTKLAKKWTYRMLMQPESFHLAICIPMELLPVKHGDQEFKKINYDSMTMWQIEKNTDRILNDIIDYIALDYGGPDQNESVRIKWMLTPKVFFKKGEYSLLQRCFQLIIYPDEPHYQMLLSISKIKMKFNFNLFFNLFLLTENENLNSESFAFSGLKSFFKVVEKRWSDCIDYEVICPHLKCRTRRSCLERCIQRNYFNVQNVTAGAHGYPVVIDKDQFSAADWMAAYFSERSDEHELARAKQKCMEEIPDGKLCNVEKFEESVEIDTIDGSIAELDLYYEIAQSVEEHPCWYTLMLDLLNIQSIFFGLTVLKLFRLAYGTLYRSILQYRVKTRKILLFLIYLACSAGCAWHIYRIFEEIVTSDLTFDQHYQIAKQIAIPEIVICFDLNMSSVAKAIKGRPLTGNYLEQLTSEMNVSEIFERIVYLDKRNRWIKLESNFSSDIFEIETFYFQFKKWWAFLFWYLIYNLKMLINV